MRISGAVLHGIVVLLVGCVRAFGAAAQEDMDFVAEHLPEAAMDNRLLALPVWYSSDASANDDWGGNVQASVARIESGRLTLQGPGVGIGLRRALDRSWSILGLAFFDRLTFAGGAEDRAVAPIFSAAFPVALPADAQLSGLTGSLRQSGAGIALRYQPELRRYSITFGALRERVRLSNYRVNYLLTSGADAGTAGVLDYSASYSFWIPFATFEWRVTHENWQLAPRFTAGLPLPQRGWRGRMLGPGFDVSGDTETIGRGKHMGDPFAGLGFGITYLPWRVTLDAGAVLNQALIEPHIHPGIERSWLLNFDWDL